MRCLALILMHAMRSLHGLQPTRGACARTSTLHATSIRGSNGANGPSHTPKQVASHPRSAQFTRAIVRSGKRGEWRRAVALLDQLERTTPRELISERAYGATLIACDRAGCGDGLGGAPRWAEATEILGRFEPDAFSVAVAVRCAGRAGRPDDAVAIFRAHAFDEDAHDAAVTALARAGRFDEAATLYDEAPWPPKVSMRRRTKWLRRSKARLEALAASATSPQAAEDLLATASLERALGDAATNGSMPSFADARARRGYERIHFVSRTTKVASALFCGEDGWLRAAVTKLLALRATCAVVSLGGGPGYDFAALATLADYVAGDTFEADLVVPERHRRPSAAIDCTVLDYEKGWRASVERLAKAFEGSRHAVSFATADITVSLDDGANAAFRADADLFVASYVVAENKNALRARDWVFFRDAFARAKPGALFLFTETTHRLWPELAAVATEVLGDCDMSLPTDLPGRSGSTLFVRKGSSAAPDEAHADMFARFADDNAAHERRLLKPAGPGGGRSQVRLAPSSKPRGIPTV